MTSAKKHMQRSRRSHSNMLNTVGTFERKNYHNTEAQSFRSENKLVKFLRGLLPEKKGE